MNLRSDAGVSHAGKIYLFRSNQFLPVTPEQFGKRILCIGKSAVSEQGFIVGAGPFDPGIADVYK